MHYLKIRCPTVTLLTRLFSRNVLSKFCLDHLSLAACFSLIYSNYINTMWYRQLQRDLTCSRAGKGSPSRGAEAGRAAQSIARDRLIRDEVRGEA